MCEVLGVFFVYGIVKDNGSVRGLLGILRFSRVFLDGGRWYSLYVENVCLFTVLGI